MAISKSSGVLSKQRGGTLFKFTLIMQLIVVIALFISLGLWQLDRANKKNELIQMFSSAEYKSSTGGLERYDRLDVSGRLDTERYLLLDNQTWQGKAGYEVFAKFTEDQTGRVFLLGLGWVEAELYREQLPSVTIPRAVKNIKVRVDSPQQLLQLAEDSWASAWPKRIQGLDLMKAEQALEVELEPWVLRLDTAVVENIQPIWKPVVMPATKHVGYAVQWFLLALAWLVCTGWVYFRVKAL